jgi:pimeloyl-ACP methyl ester carboxylesterase
MIEEARGCIAYDEHGVGPTVVLVPGSCSTGAAWRSVTSQWENRFRCVTTSLLGYGGTAERRNGRDSCISHEAEIVESVVRRTARPAHLVGHSFGGLVALAVALRNQVPLLSLTIVEAPAVGLVREHGERRHDLAFREMTDAYFTAFRRGDEEAIARMIDFYGGDGTFASWPPQVRAFVVGATAVNVLDWASAYGFAPPPSALANTRVPALVIVGEKSHPAARHANELLSRCISTASLVTIAGAAHFMIMTHAEELADAIARHVARAEYSRGITGSRPSMWRVSEPCPRI